MAGFFGPGRSVERIALTWLIVGYLGLLPCFFAQIRWLTPDHEANSVRLALAVFVPKCCDIGAYTLGRLIGRHKMTPVLSPKKTWEGAFGGVIAAVLAAVAIDRLGPTPVLGEWHWQIGFGVSVGIAGMLGDLAESLIKRDCQTKDASAAVPGFGGVLDVVDAIIFAAPVAYLWFALLPLAAN
jgi:phosphatidate cytidylyltransferase